MMMMGGQCHSLYTVMAMPVPLNTSSRICLTLGHCSRSRPHPINGMDSLVTPFCTACSLIATSDCVNEPYVGLWKYLGLVTRALHFVKKKKKGRGLSALRVLFADCFNSLNNSAIVKYALHEAAPLVVSQDCASADLDTLGFELRDTTKLLLEHDRNTLAHGHALADTMA